MSSGVVMMVSWGQAARLVPEDLALSMPRTLPFCQIPRRRMPLQQPMPKISSICSLVRASERRLLSSWSCAVSHAAVVVETFVVVFEFGVPCVGLFFLQKLNRKALCLGFGKTVDVGRFDDACDLEACCVQGYNLPVGPTQKESQNSEQA